MRIDRLDLIAYGGFTDKSLDLSSGEEGIHMVFGANEAGKSVALRALRALFFGIPVRTSDNFLHKNPQLRIGVLISRNKGSESLEFRRRKGNQNTLLDSNEDAIPDGDLLKYIPGIDEGLFCTLFGLNHDDLRIGGKEILDGKGHLGEALFSAGSGLKGLRNCVESLGEDANAILKQRGTTIPLNAEINKYQEAEKIIRDNTLSQNKVNQHRKQIASINEELKDLENKIKELQTEKNRLDRVKAAYPFIGRLKDAREKLKKLEGVSPLAEDFTERRKTIQSDLKNAREALGKSIQEEQSLKSERDEINIPERLVEHKEKITALHNQNVINEKNMSDLEQRKREHEKAVTTARTLLSQVLPGKGIDDLKQYDLAEPERQGIRRTGKALVDAENELETIKNTVEEISKEVSALTNDLKALDASKDPTRLKNALKTARTRGDIEETIVNLNSSITHQTSQINAKIQRLQNWSGDLASLETAEFPTEEIVDDFISKLSDYESQLKTLAERKANAEVQIEELGKRKFALIKEGEAPVESELESMRTKRDLGWQLILRSWKKNEDIADEEKAYDSSMPLDHAYSNNVNLADETADIMRKESERIAKREQIEESIADQERIVQEIEAKIEAVNSQIKDVNDKWNPMWEKSGLVPLQPKSMKDWLRNKDEIISMSDQIKDYKRQIEEKKQLWSGHIQELNKCLEDLGEDKRQEKERFISFLDRCSDIVDRIEQNNRDRENIQKQINSKESKLKELGVEEKETTARVLGLRKSWEDLMSGLSMPPKTKPSDIEDLFDNMLKIFKLRDDADRLSERIAQIEASNQEFCSGAASFCDSIEEDIQGIPASQKVESLFADLEKALQDKERKEQIEKNRKRHEQLSEQEKEKVSRLESDFKDLLTEAACEAIEDLEKREEESSAIRKLQAGIEQDAESILTHSGGVSLDDFLSMAETLSPDEAAAEIQRIDGEIKDCDNQKMELSGEKAKQESEWDKLCGAAEAAKAAEDARGYLEKIKDYAEDYATKKLAETILRLYIDKFRDENQGAMMGRASEIFNKLTLGKYEKLDSDFDNNDNIILVGVRDGNKTRLTLTKGTKAQ